MNFKKFYESQNSPFAVFVVAKLPNGKLAATTRAKDTGEEGKIGLPGGKVDPGEDPLKAAYRESKEEGWKVYDVGLEPIHKDFVDGKEIWWYESSGADPLSDYNEKDRGIGPIEVEIDDIANSGFGNEFLKNYF